MKVDQKFIDLDLDKFGKQCVFADDTMNKMIKTWETNLNKE